MIHPEFKSLNHILSDKIFSIPEYQRHYSWQKKQRKDLFCDIEKIYKEREKDKSKIHFMATIVCLKTQAEKIVGSDSFCVYSVVDGQQRLTTLIILLKAISIKLRTDGLINEADKLDFLLVKGDERLIILQNNIVDKSLLREYLQNGYVSNDSSKTSADENIKEAIKNCTDFVNDEKNIKVIDLLALLKNGLYFIFLSMEDEGAVYTVFEVLNSRGLDVDWLDKCKSVLMGLLYEQANILQNEAVFKQHLTELYGCWTEIYGNIGIRNIDGDEIVKFTATLMNPINARKVMSAEESLEFIKKNSSSINEIITNTNLIKKVTVCLSKLHDNKRQAAVTYITQARLLAVSIMLTYDGKDRFKLLDQWERTTFKIYGLFKRDSRTAVGDYVSVAKEIYVSKNKENKNDVNFSVDNLVKKIAKIGSDKNGVTEFDISTVDKELKKDCYNDWSSEELRYFFFKYEEYTSKQKGSQINDATWTEIWGLSASKTIEHILPQDENATGWEHFTTEEYEEYLHSIGNLCLLSQTKNSQAGNHPFDFKKTIYPSANMNSLENVIACNVWNKEAIEERTERLITFAKEQWKDLDV